MVDKVKELSNEEFVKLVLEKDEGLANEVSVSELDAAKIIGKAKPSIDRYSVNTGIGYAIARLKEALLEASSESIKGILVGERDIFGTNAPIRLPVISKDGKHTEIVNWGTNVKYGDAKIELPFPCTAVLNVLEKGEYRGVPNIQLVSMASYENVSPMDTVARLGKVSKSVGELDNGDELSVVVIRGKISYISAATRWKGKEKDGSWGVWLPNQRDNPVNHMVAQISLETENNNVVRVQFGRQRVAVPTVIVEDLNEICEDASKKFSDPMEQAKFVGEVFRGRDVFIVGFMTKYNPQPEVNYIEVGGYAIFDAEVSGKQATLDAPAKTETKKHPKTKSEPASDEDEDDAGEPVSETKKSSPAKKTPPAKDGASSIESLKEKIRQYCNVLGITPGDLSPDNEIFTTLAPGKTKSFVREAIDELKKE